jgi:ABC-2 type transport system permease protein
MRAFLAFMKKEWMEQIRSSRLVVLTILFVLFGIMNPAIAKLTPWIFEVMAESMEESGMVITAVEVDAMASWVQFFKNVPMALIVFVIMQSNIFTKEYQSGTLVLALTKGLHRYKVVLSKATVLTTMWTVLYWMHFGITYMYNDYFWDNSVAKNLLFSVTCWWIFGLWVIALQILFSTIASANTGVMVGTGAVVAVCYFASLLPKLTKYIPTLLIDGNSLIYGEKIIEDYEIALIITIVTGIACLVASVPILNKKRI